MMSKLQIYYTDIFYYLNILGKFGIQGVLACKRLPNAIIIACAKFGYNLKNKYLYLRMKDTENPVCLRYQSSDAKVLIQIFIEGEYACLDKLKNSNLIVDCGANVGYSSIYFLNKFPHAHIIAVEPDDENFEVCQKNLLPYNKRVSLIPSGVWSHSVGLIVCKGIYGDGRSWATQVKECPEYEKADLQAIDITTILKNSGFDSIDILKIDVERSEIAIFSDNYEYWLDKTKNIAIELHDEECENVFFNAMSAYEYELVKSGELTFCLSITKKA